jgi:hypothetical protein
MKKNEPKKSTNIIFSYCPLLNGPPGVSYLGEEAMEAAERMLKLQDELPSGSARACLWVLDEDGPKAILAMEQADAIAEHFKHWAEGKPEEWFKFHFLEKGPSYAVALFPNFMKSAERWKIAFQLRHGYPPVPGGESHFFRPLHCTAKTKVAFDQVKKHLESKVRVGLVGDDEISPENYRISMDEVRWLGEFHVINENSGKKLAHGWLESQIEEMWKSEGLQDGG